MSEPKTLEPPTPPAQTDPRGSKLRNVLIAVGSGLILVAIAYGIGRAQGLVEVKKVREQAEASEDKLEAQIGKLRAELETTRKRIALLEARRGLSQALNALEGRNFGVAHKKLEFAAQTMSGASDDEALKKLSATLSTHKLVATENVGEQRDQLVSWMDAFDERVPYSP